MNKMNFYKKLNFPEIPAEILLNLKNKLYNTVVVPDIGYGITHIKNNKSLVSCKYIYSHIACEDFELWLKHNIPDVSIDSALMQSQHSINNLPSTHIVHTDIERRSSLNYIIDTGGEDVTTSWYKEKNKNLHRESKSINQQSDSGFVNYDNLELLESVNFQKNNWYVIDTRILHDVDNITNIRRSISINLFHRDYLNF